MGDEYLDDLRDPHSAPPDALRGRALAVTLEAVEELHRGEQPPPPLAVPVGRPWGTGVEGVWDEADEGCARRNVHPCGPGCAWALGPLYDALLRARAEAQGPPASRTR